MASVVTHLQKWYANQCDGNWEHDYSIKIETLDNPGWIVKIDLGDTPSQGLVLRTGLIEKSPEDWYSISFEGDRFVGIGDPAKLEFILEFFAKHIV